MNPLWVIVALILICQNSIAKRQVDFEWEIIEGASLYLVEIKNNSGEFKKLKSKNSAFSIKMNPGKYEIHGRVIDDTENLSQWSPWKAFDIPPEKVKITKAPPKESKISKNSYVSLIPVTWEPSFGADHYIVEIFDSQGKLLGSKKVTSNEIKLRLRPGLYKLKIKGNTADNVESEPFETTEPFLVQNIPIEPPQKVLLDLSKHIITYEPIPGTDVVATLESQKFLSENWTVILKKSDATNLFDLTESLRPGKYRVTLVSKNPFGDFSIPVIKEFQKKPIEEDLPE